MEDVNTNEPRTWGLPRIASVTALGMALTLAMLQVAHAGRITTPPVPPGIEVPVNTRLFFIGHGVGTQDYVCAPSTSGAGVAFALFTPQAVLFNDDEQQVTTHFFSLNPFESNVVRATWQHSQDTSTVWGAVTDSSTDARFVTPGAIAWLRIEIVGAQAGPTGGAKLVRTKFMQRLNTVGGSAPAKGCTTSKDLGNKAFVPYKADYFFYEDATRYDSTDHQNQ